MGLLWSAHVRKAQGDELRGDIACDTGQHDDGDYLSPTSDPQYGLGGRDRQTVRA
jgi:hypothetical protein